mmetsp:Transcript_17810/g.24531  ORF Transcript_17810/g.24531 Transcript_17810/m.24531 type:complete len:147 (-) Transcript_17810:353-793(-)|eukprot:CAMPEP_0185726222 /NCGR_PEP_ID=MMETSP1171-20130828/2270_1 /TAXON_ID=374046 /ORGANISM="Helicotheca tamensis, Strain CCMP826" /LENGTH=146 /DNA_ID=CAMNT_0028394535 /DNA_START=58 /DNA_END=498 /DNA_ORIENTATION=-
MMKYALFLLACPLLSGYFSAAFSPATVSSRRSSDTALAARSSGRKAFLNNALVAAFTAVTVSSSAPVWADEGTVDDLAMPSPEEQKAKEDAEMAARLARKAELQKKAAKPTSFADSLKSEKAKQKDLVKSKEERRNALCEELGRGC